MKRIKIIGLCLLCVWNCGASEVEGHRGQEYNPPMRRELAPESGRSSAGDVDLATKYLIELLDERLDFLGEAFKLCTGNLPTKSLDDLKSSLEINERLLLNNRKWKDEYAVIDLSSRQEIGNAILSTVNHLVSVLPQDDPDREVLNSVIAQYSESETGKFVLPVSVEDASVPSESVAAE